jgi:hypothetical protein
MSSSPRTMISTLWMPRLMTLAVALKAGVRAQLDAVGRRCNDEVILHLLYPAEREWTRQRIAEALNVSTRQISRDLDGFAQTLGQHCSATAAMVTQKRPYRRVVRRLRVRPFWRRSSQLQRRAAILPKDGTTALLPMLMGRSFLRSTGTRSASQAARSAGHWASRTQVGSIS